MALYRGRGSGKGKLYALSWVFLTLLLLGHVITGKQEKLKAQRGVVAPSLLGKSYDYFDSLYGVPLVEKELLYNEGLEDDLCKRFINHGIASFDSVYYAFWQKDDSCLGACFTLDRADVWRSRTVLFLTVEQFLADQPNRGE